MNERTEARPTRPLASKQAPRSLVAALGGALALGGAAGLAAAHGGDRMVGRIADRLELDAAQTEARSKPWSCASSTTGESLRGDGLRDRARERC